MERREFLAAAAGVAASGAAGCLAAGGGDPSPTETTTPSPTRAVARNFEPVSGGPMNDDDLPPDDSPDDGFPPAFEREPPERTVDPSTLPEMTVNPDSFAGSGGNGIAVPLLPIDIAYYWYWAGTARFADARARGGYDISHIFGAVSSPAPTGGEGPDPVADWPKDDPIVCYCGCPHHLSGLRAANLIKGGYQHVYVIDEGYWEWQDRGYPLAGEDVETRPALRVIDGMTRPEYAGGTAWAVHRATDQNEAAPIRADGSYSLRLRFADVTPDSIIEIDTPGYTVAAPLGELMDGVVTG